jgi:hypothetical protein
MSGFLTPPTFTPPVPSIPLGTTGQVLTMVGGVPAFATPGAGGGTFAGRVAYASPAGANNNVSPPVVLPATWLTTHRLIVTLAGGNANWTGLLAGADGQLLLVTNADAANSLELDAQNGGSLAANQFLYQFSIVLGPGVSKLLCYDATLAKWLLT